MANRTWYPSASSGLNRVFMEFELLGAGAAALTLSPTGGAASCVESVTRGGVGVYTVTLKDQWNKVVSKGVDLDDTLNDGGYATMGNVLNEGGALPIAFKIYTRAAAGTATDAAVGRRLSVKLTLRNGVQLGGG